MSYSDVSQAAAAVSNPATSAQDLADIVTQYPSLWAQVAAHPNAYDELLTWLNQAGDEQVRAAVAIHRQGPPPSPSTSDTSATVTQQYPASTWAASGSTQPSSGSSSGLGSALTSAKTPKNPKAQRAPKSPRGPKSANPAPGWQPKQPAQPAATGPSAPSGQPSQVTVVEKKGGLGMAILIVGLCVVLVLGAAAAGYFLWWKPRHDAENTLAEAQLQYTTTVASYNDDQDELQKAIDEANAFLDLAEPEDVGDADLLTDLRDAVDAAEPLIVAAPEMATDAQAIQNQVRDLTEMQKQTNAATKDVRDKFDKATDAFVKKASDTLQEAIEAAQKQLSSAESKPGVSQEVQALEDAVSDALEAVDTLKDIELDQVFATVDKNVAALSEATKALEEAVANSCGGVDLPDGVTDLVCGGMPSGATTPRVTTAYGEDIQFSASSGNIGCTANAYTFQVICEITKRDWTMPPEILSGCLASGGPGATCKGDLALAVIMVARVSAYQTSDVPPWAANKIQKYTIPTLAVGASADMAESVACYSAKDGVTCWDIESHHGFKISQDKFLHW